MEDNLCIKGYHLLKKDFDLPPVKIHLHKHIPIGAGLGGGLFIAKDTAKNAAPANVTLNNVNFSNDAAAGGMRGWA